MPRTAWEPIYIGTNEEPLYDERLTWEGKRDKMSQVSLLFAWLNTGNGKPLTKTRSGWLSIVSSSVPLQTGREWAAHSVSLTSMEWYQREPIELLAISHLKGCIWYNKNGFGFTSGSLFPVWNQPKRLIFLWCLKGSDWEACDLLSERAHLIQWKLIATDSHALLTESRVKYALLYIPIISNPDSNNVTKQNKQIVYVWNIYFFFLFADVWTLFTGLRFLCIGQRLPGTC